ncbi:hypothetical protein QJS04_geneDACA003679 [Acorus gramineus]|uniref:Uncharacterized protein n=1 Tax=Acorus gramineus TaxID=55184 RepID=A0AAV9BM47_ACOGR|nr:hypothetical protein QJS04_geneDACA003679 [Acorus gramineus]
MHDCNHRIGTLLELHHREHINPGIVLLFAACQRCPIQSEMPLHLVEWGRGFFWDQCQSNASVGPFWCLQCPDTSC